MKETVHIKELLRTLTEDVKKELKAKPFFLVTEHDLSGFLYSKIFQMKAFQETFQDIAGKPNFRLHMEYPRYWEEKGKPKRKGRYDLAILRKDKPLKIFNNDLFITKQVWLGFETKLLWDSTGRRVVINMENDLPAFTNEDNKIPADNGVIFHVNAGRKPNKENDLMEIKRKMEGLQKTKLVPNPLYLVYIESYRENNKPEVVFV